MTLFRELPEEKQNRFVDISLRNMDVARTSFLDVVRRALIFLAVILVVGVVVVLILDRSMPAGHRHFSFPLGCFLLGLLFVGIVNALDFELSRFFLLRISGRLGKAFRNELQVEATDPPPPKPWTLYLSSGCAYIAFILWMIGSVSTFMTFTAVQPAFGVSTSSYVNYASAPMTPSAASRQASPAVDAQHDAHSGWSAGDKIATISIIVGFLQFVALIATYWIMRNTARRQLRAYVFPHTIGVYEGSVMDPPQPAHTNEPGVVIEFKNCGQTPAYRFISWAEIAVIEPINEDKLVVPEAAERFSLSLPPGGTSTKSLWLRRKLTAQEIADIQANVRAIYVYGRIEYWDVYKKKHFTNIRVANSGVWPPAPGAGFNFCDKGNEAD
jgi:hypothetical protein